MKLSRNKARLYESESEFAQIYSELNNLIECPILYSKFVDPYIAPSGQIYEKLTMENLQRNHKIDPFTRQKFIPNIKRPHYLCKNIVSLTKKYANKIKNLQ